MLIIHDVSWNKLLNSRFSPFASLRPRGPLNPSKIDELLFVSVSVSGHLQSHCPSIWFVSTRVPFVGSLTGPLEWLVQWLQMMSKFLPNFYGIKFLPEMPYRNVVAGQISSLVLHRKKKTRFMFSDFRIWVRSGKIRYGITIINP